MHVPGVLYLADALKCQQEEEALITPVSYLHERSAELELPSS